MKSTFQVSYFFYQDLFSAALTAFSLPDSRAPSPKPATSPTPAFPPNSPRASDSSRKRSISSARCSPSPQPEDADAEHLACLEAELESLRRQERIATLQREIEDLRKRTGSTDESKSSLTRKIKAEPGDSQRAVKKVKDEIADASLPPAIGNSKKKQDVIVLDDSQ